MLVKNTNVTQTPEILNRLLGGELFVPVTIATASYTNGVCKAGTPIDANGAIANDATVTQAWVAIAKQLQLESIIFLQNDRGNH